MRAPRPAPHPAALAALAATITLALFFAPALRGPGQFLSRDAGRLHAPVKRWVAGRLARGELPEWNPYDGLGAPVVANAVDAVQHPFNLLLLALPFEAGFKAWVLLSYLLAALGGHAWLRALRCSPVAACAGGLAFALSGVLVSTSDNLTYLTAFAAIPWLLAAGARLVEARSPGRLVAVLLASALCAAAGDPQGWTFAVLALTLQPLLLGSPDGGGGASGRAGVGSALRDGLVALAAALAGAAPFILPVAAWLPHSSRAAALSELDQVRFSLAPLRLLELGLPGLTRGAAGQTASDVYREFAGDPVGVPWYVSVYAGAGVLALAAAGAQAQARARRLLLIAAVLTWMALGHFAGFGQLARHLPVLSALRFWEKLTVWPALLLTAAAAFGLDALRAPGPRASRLARWSGLAALAAAVPAAAAAIAPGPLARLLSPAPGAAPEVARRFVDDLGRGTLHAAVALAALAVAALLLSRRRGTAASLAVAAVVVVDLALGNAGAWRLSPAEVADPHGPIADPLAAAAAPPRVLTPFTISERHHPSVPELAPADEAWWVAGRLLYAAFNVPRRVGNFEPGAPLAPERLAALVRRLGPRRLLPAAGLFAVDHVVVPRAPDAAAGVGLAPPYEVAAEDLAIPAFLVRVPHRPRVYLARQVSSATREEAFAFAEAWTAASDRTVVEDAVPPDARLPAGAAEIVREAPEEIAITATTDARALLVLSDAIAPGWTAEVDGRPAAIRATNALVRGVWIDAGAHAVRFRYRTPGLRAGWGVFLAGLLAVGAWAVVATRRADVASGASGCARAERVRP